MFVRFYSRKKVQNILVIFLTNTEFRCFDLHRLELSPFPHCWICLCVRVLEVLLMCSMDISCYIDLFIYISCTSISYLTSTYAFNLHDLWISRQIARTGRHVHSISPNNHYISPFNLSISFKIKFKLKSIYPIEMTIILQTAYNNEACIGYVHVY